MANPDEAKDGYMASVGCLSKSPYFGMTVTVKQDISVGNQEGIFSLRGWRAYAGLRSRGRTVHSRRLDPARTHSLVDRAGVDHRAHD
jgi:hypothetical protein